MDEGIPLAGKQGLWRIVLVECKRGESKRIDADRLQLCAQALSAVCLQSIALLPLRMLAWIPTAASCMSIGQAGSRWPSA